MKKYLSSFRIGDHGNQLYEMFGENKKIAYIANALDHYDDHQEGRLKHQQDDITEINQLGLHAELLDLKAYFGNKEKLTQKLKQYGGVFVSGGNTFILAQAYKLSGFGEIMQEYELSGTQFIYAGYSAGICILSPSLKGLDIVDDPNTHPYPELQETVWEGLSIIPYSISPHYDSDHPESADIDKEIKYCVENKILFKALRDGEVIIEEEKKLIKNINLTN